MDRLEDVAARTGGRVRRRVAVRRAAARDLREAGVSAVAVVDEEAAVRGEVGMEGEAEQAALAAVHDARGDVDVERPPHGGGVGRGVGGDAAGEGDYADLPLNNEVLIIIFSQKKSSIKK